MGLFFASYLVKLGRLGGKKGGKQAQMPPVAKEFSEVVKKQSSENASMRTGSTQSGSDQEAQGEADKLL